MTNGQPHTCTTQRGNGACSKPRYKTGTDCPAACVLHGLSLSVISFELAGKTRFDFFSAKKGNLRAWMFLAWAQLSRGHEPPSIQTLILEAEIIEESAA